MLTRQELLQNPDLYRDKARGALIGLAIGDSFGDASRKPRKPDGLRLYHGFQQGRQLVHRRYGFAMLTAQILIESGGRPTSDCGGRRMAQARGPQDELKRGGASEFEASRNLRKGLRPPAVGQVQCIWAFRRRGHAHQPVGVLCAGDIDRAIAMAEIDASISHDREGIWGRAVRGRRGSRRHGRCGH